LLFDTSKEHDPMTTMHPLPFPVDPTSGSRAASSVRVRFVPGPIPGSPAWNARTGFDRHHHDGSQGGIATAIRSVRHHLPNTNPVEGSA
jgi:hypothetical protein